MLQCSCCVWPMHTSFVHNLFTASCANLFESNPGVVFTLFLSCSNLQERHPTTKGETLGLFHPRTAERSRWQGTFWQVPWKRILSWKPEVSIFSSQPPFDGRLSTPSVLKKKKNKYFVVPKFLDLWQHRKTTERPWASYEWLKKKKKKIQFSKSTAK